ncbi:carbon-nitrogen hydrolase family protein [uncultured Sphingomonas sp.]|uniref:carbon-nitrogen hydrolase family protein n=1 Tax=uncultured Sphingomonas sp. TaxID=158754 RepID=UPI0025E7A3F7|nr:carbon-nitrogen hydrolase family protein [uncultured Sphingomonas sp.]
MRAAILQMTSGIDPAANARTLTDAIDEATRGGAAMLFTPEMSGLIDRSRDRAAGVITAEDDDRVLGSVRDAAVRTGLWVHLGSLAVRREDGRLVNRAFVIDGNGTVRARYDKLHLFDVDLPTGESWRESAAYVGGDAAVVVATPLGNLGLSICYDVRFPSLYQRLSDAGATLIAVPAAFTRPTGAAHWQVLLQARAIENAAFVIAAAQTGRHEDGRETYGHSLAIGPWGEVLCDMGEQPGLALVDIDAEKVSEVRGRIPVTMHRRDIPPVRVVP